MGISFLAGCIAIYFLRRWARKRQANTGQTFPVFSVSVGILVLLPFISWLVGGAPTAMSVPELKGFNFQGGVNVSPEFSALLLGLVLYTAAFVAEAVRAGIQSVSKGQREAAMSIGLKNQSGPPAGHFASGPEGDYPAADQPDVESDQEQLIGGGHRLSRFCLGGQHNHESDRPIFRRRGLDYAGLFDF